jgi:YesN/AraC family two-component response regulator
MIKVVVVDDEVLLRKGLISTTPWSSLDCEVVGEASDADEGEEVIKNLQPDIVIMDIKMPGRTGLELIKSLKSEAGCEFIILSGYGEFSYAQKAIDLGVNSYLLKPVGDEELLEAIRKTVALVKEKAFYKKLNWNMISSGRWKICSRPPGKAATAKNICKKPCSILRSIAARRIWSLRMWPTICRFLLRICGSFLARRRLILSMNI